MAFTAGDAVPLTQARTDWFALTDNEHVLSLLINETEKGLEDVATGKVSDAKERWLRSKADVQP